jgi:2-polyprenyl-6-methoxyphenol hydroxylase-like FAD-dependent oxidoreductase
MDGNPLTKQLYEDPSLQLWLAPGRHSIATAVHRRNEYDLQVTDHEYGFEPDGSVGTWNERITDMDWLRNRFKDFDPAIVTILAKATSCWKWRLAESAALPSWTSESGTVVLLGDSCHAMLPFAGQGAAQCIKTLQCSQNCLLKPHLPEISPGSLGSTKNFANRAQNKFERMRGRTARIILCQTVQSRRGEMRY